MASLQLGSAAGFEIDAAWRQNWRLKSRRLNRSRHFNSPHPCRLFQESLPVDPTFVPRLSPSTDVQRTPAPLFRPFDRRTCAFAASARSRPPATSLGASTPRSGSSLPTETRSAACARNTSNQGRDMGRDRQGGELALMRPQGRRGNRRCDGRSDLSLARGDLSTAALLIAQRCTARNPQMERVSEQHEPSDGVRGNHPRHHAVSARLATSARA